MSVMTPVSWGELIDKFTILEIKLERIRDPTKVANVGRERQAILPMRNQALRSHPGLTESESALKAINEEIWGVEDEIRDCERRQEFGTRFIELARAVYHTNDRRALVKRQINELLGSELVEEKSYQSYQVGLPEGKERSGEPETYEDDRGSSGA